MEKIRAKIHLALKVVLFTGVIVGAYISAILSVSRENPISLIIPVLTVIIALGIALTIFISAKIDKDITRMSERIEAFDSLVSEMKSTTANYNRINGVLNSATSEIRDLLVQINDISTKQK